MRRTFQWVETAEELARLSEKAISWPKIFLDTEFDSGPRGTKLCLLQIGSADEIFLVDAFAFRNLHQLGAALARTEATWVLHAGSQDIPLIEAAIGRNHPGKVFDLQVAYALVSPENNVSLAYLKFRLLGIRSDKAHQADDWTMRPLSRSQLEYAASDVEELPELEKLLEQRLRAERKLEAACLASAEAVTPRKSRDRSLSLESFRNAWQLAPRNQAALRYLIDWYNSLDAADRADAPDSKTLLALCSRLPESTDALLRIKGVPHGFAKRHGKRIVEGLRDAARESKGKDFVPLDPPPYGSFPEQRAQGYLAHLRAEICYALNVSPDLVLPGRVMAELEHVLVSGEGTPLWECLDGYRSSLLGAKLREFCEKSPPPV